ncbi:MAG TPA: UDP-N-acetylmuramoyl-tripeptide--D-alanyl-D-alanine ligase [Thermoanaerobaculia bacterium]|nr:UDP-N-acetylmuramoyl-tripeptide--D-alanyl-D-alanine ligase [Thermoanaerobaculia bacterium]
MRRRLDDTARRLGGEVIAGDPGGVWDRAAIDSRAVTGGELFFALAGERTDGHRFVGDAFARGAAAAVVDRDVRPALPAGAAGAGEPAGGCLLRVADSYAALHELTRALRREVPEVLVAVTGSAGKTTTKELLAAMCERRFRTARNPGNLNNLYGFPVSFLSIPDATEVMVAELGMSVAGELGAVSRLARPDAVVLINVRPVHLENFPDLSAIAEAKAEIFEGLARSGFVVANRSDPEVTRVVRRWRAETGGRVVWFAPDEATEAGGGDEAEVRARRLRPRAGRGEAAVGSRFLLELGAEAIEVELPLHGAHNVDNAVAAAAAARELGVTGEEIRDALAAAAPAAHRGAVHRLPDGVTLVDDSYNSNPDALARALAWAAELAEAAGGGRRVAVLGDMLELGPEQIRFHREAGERAARLGFSPLAGVGELSRELVAAAGAAGAAAAWLPDAGAAAAWAEETVRPGDVVLVKGSRGIGLDAVVERLLAAQAVEGGA